MAVFKKHDVAADMHGITEGVIWKQMLLFFFPILLGTFFQQLYNTVDAMVVGKFVGKQALAAVGGATGTLVNLIVGFFVGLSSGATVIISQYFGAREENGVSRTVHTAIAMGLGGGLILSIAGIIVSPAILRLMDTPEEVMAYATTYIRIYFAGMIPSLIYNIGSGILRAVGDSKRPLYFLICACLVNIVLDIVLVLYANMGVAGAALATIFSQAVSALLVILALLHATPALRLHWRKIRLHGDLLPRIIRIGLPAGLQSVMYSLSNLVIQSSINRFGTDMMATWTAYGKLDSFFWMIISAFGVTITTFVGQNFGAHKYDRMRKSIRTCLVMATVATLLVTGLLLTFGETLYRLFTDEEVVIQKGMQVLRLLAPFYCTYIGVEVFAGTVRGAGDSLIPMLMTLFGVCVLRVVWVTLIAPMKPDVTFMLLSYPITWSFTSILFIIYYFKGSWLERCERKAGYAHVDGRV